jgi:hypothetical protein
MPANSKESSTSFTPLHNAKNRVPFLTCSIPACPQRNGQQLQNQGNKNCRIVSISVIMAAHPDNIKHVSNSEACECSCAFPFTAAHLVKCSMSESTVSKPPGAYSSSKAGVSVRASDRRTFTRSSQCLSGMGVSYINI